MTRPTASSQDDPAEDGGKQRIERNRFDGLEKSRADRHDEYGCQRREGKGFADLLITEKQERKIEQCQKDTKRQMKEVS